MSSMQSLFQRIADCYHGTVVAEQIREPVYARIAFLGEDDMLEGACELMAFPCKDSTGADVHLVRVQGCVFGNSPDGTRTESYADPQQQPVLVTPIPSAIIAVALR